MPERVVVVAAVITPPNAATRSDRPLMPQTQVLLSKRPEGKHLAGCWEFPGGQIEPGESAEEALIRELREELGIAVHASTPWTSVTHQYLEKTVVLNVHRVTDWSGVASGKEGQAIEWVPWHRVPERSMPPADRAFLKVFGMAPFALMLSPAISAQAPSRALSELSERLAWIHQTELADHPWWLHWTVNGRTTDSIGLAKEAMQMIRQAGHVAMLNGSLEMAQSVGADGIHLSAEEGLALTERPEGLSWVSMACHDSATLQHATCLAADFVTVSPLRQTASHPGQSGLGGEQVKALLANAGVPVLALGGLSTQDLAWARSLGCFGVASLQGFVRG